jgi:hypothetical protein
MPHRAALHLSDLATIWDAEPTPVVRELLWEIHRLQSTIRRAQQVREMIRGQAAGVPAIVWLAFEQELDAEPCLADELTGRQRKRIERWRVRREAEQEKAREKESRRKEVYPEEDPIVALLSVTRGCAVK